MNYLNSLDAQTANCLRAAEDFYNDHSKEQIDAIASPPVVAKLLNEFEFGKLFSRKVGKGKGGD